MTITEKTHPAVVVDTEDGLDHWSGYNPLKIEEHFGRKGRAA